MWQGDDNNMELNQGWNIPNRGEEDKNNGQQQQSSAMGTENDKLGLDSYYELLGAIGGGGGSGNSGNSVDGGSCPVFNLTSGSTFNNNTATTTSNDNSSERSMEGLNKNEGSHNNKSENNFSSGGDNGENKPVANDFLKALLSENWGKTMINQEKSWHVTPHPQSGPNVNNNNNLLSFGASSSSAASSGSGGGKINIGTWDTA